MITYFTRKGVSMKTKNTISIFLNIFLVCFSNLIGSNVSFVEEDGLRRIGSESKTSSFNEMLVDHAKSLCNDGFHSVFKEDCRPFLDFWNNACECNLDVEKAYTCMRLFHKSIKSCAFINHDVVENVLSEMSALENYFNRQQVKKESSKYKNIYREVENLLLERYTDNFEQIQEKPTVFISLISSEVIDTVKTKINEIKQEEEEKEYRDGLQNITLRFFDEMLSRQYWYEESYQKIWPSFINVSEYLHKLANCGIIKCQDHLDELWDSHRRRFQNYLAIDGALLPVEFYEKIEEDLKNSLVFCFEAPEQDEGITTKKEEFAKSLLAAKTKAIACERALVEVEKEAS